MVQTHLRIQGLGSATRSVIVLHCVALSCTVLYCNVMYGIAFEDSLKCGERSKRHFLLPKAVDDPVHVLLGA